MIEGKLGELTYEVERARGTHHSPVLFTGAFAANQGVLPCGLLLSRGAGGTYEPFAAGGEVAAVLDEDLDTELATAGIVILHGSARKDCLKVGAANPAAPTEEQLALLRDAGIYPE